MVHDVDEVVSCRAVLLMILTAEPVVPQFSREMVTGYVQPQVTHAFKGLFSYLNWTVSRTVFFFLHPFCTV